MNILKKLSHKFPLVNNLITRQKLRSTMTNIISVTPLKLKKQPAKEKKKKTENYKNNVKENLKKNASFNSKEKNNKKTSAGENINSNKDKGENCKS